MIVALAISAMALALGAILFLVIREERVIKHAATPQGTLEAVWNGTDRRQHPRWLVSCPFRYRVYPHDAREHAAQAVVQDAGRGGIAVRMPEHLASGVWLEMDIIIPQAPALRAMGEVRWSRELLKAHALAPREFLTGIHFSKVADVDVSRLIAFAQQREPV